MGKAVEARLVLCYTGINTRALPLNYSLGGTLLDSFELARQILDIIEEKQATDIVLLDIREQTVIADYFIVATIDSERQARAIQDELLETLGSNRELRPRNKVGREEQSGGWILIDYGDVILHLFTQETREFYQLEELWANANVVVKML
jgi:ribosome-associated protein